ncbi:MAG TPA: extracellular solute-binding protein, partial [Geminicoccaceae bacterium]|nr:extracellular solute-binding protein [Geminicoccaceae bacterium]
MNLSNRLRVGCTGAALTLLLTAGWSGSASAQTEIKIGYMKHAIHEANVAMMEKWAAANNVKLTKIPMAYDVFQEKVTATLTSGGDQFDVIWHNDDWGQLWEKWVEPTDDTPNMDTVDTHPLDAFINDDGKVTVVPMAHTVGTFFYRTDLVAEDEVPTTFQELVDVSKRLQEEGKVKWGYVGGMKMNHTWFSFWWSMWSNNCDIFLPIYERDNQVLADNGWAPAIAEPCQQEIVEFWLDAINTHKISPPGMTAYGRDEANAI